MGATVPRGLAATSDRSTIPTVRHAIAVASGKGGVGKSTVSVNVAVALAETGASVGLLDGDIYGPNIPIMMGIKQALERSETGKITPPVQYGVRLVSVGFVAGESDAIIYRGPLVGKMIQRFLSGVDWGDLDYLIIDLPPGTGDASLTLAQSAPLTGAVIVTTPQEVALADVRKCITMFRRVNVPILGVVENMSYFLCPRCGERTDIFSHGGGRAASEELDLPFLGEIPLDPRVRVGGDEGRPIVVANPDSSLALAFREIAGNLAARVSVVTLTGPDAVQIELPKKEPESSRSC
ncbi:MAG: Mrp/NBP35 family ATP-binding protein [Candidatus Latescibacteria bacterium]|nr:Mrp/NBP35 family ATP-binding protein [Candidatus Latescibacterota bacterium]